MADVIKEVDESETFGSFFVTNFGSNYCIKEIFLSDDSNGKNSIQAEVNHPVRVTLTFGKTFVKFVVTTKDTDESASQSVNAADVLMANSRRLAQQGRGRNIPQLPEVLSKENKKSFNKKDELYNAIIEMLKAKEIFFPNAHVAQNEGKVIIGVLRDVLWHIDEHHEKFHQRSHQSIDVPPLPLTFHTFRGFNDSVKKKKAARLDSSILSQDVQNLYYILTFPVIQGEVWRDMHAAIKQLAECLGGYVEYLRVENAKQQYRQSAMEPVRTPFKDFDVYESEPVVLVSSEYSALNSVIRRIDEYDVIHLDEKFTPIDRRKRYEYIRGLKLSVPIQVFRYNRSGSLGTMTFVWKLPLDKRQRATQKLLEVIDSIRSSIPVYHTRSMRREFCARFGLICKIPPLIINEMYRSLTGDASAVPNPEIVGRLQTLLHSEYLTDSSIIVDLREKNEGRPSKFTRFWELLSHVLQDYNEAAANDRRHSQAHMPVAMSIPDLSRKVQEKIPKEEKGCFDIPSNEWIRLQFLPRSPHSQVSLRFVKQFDIKFQVQRRILRANHEDTYYAAAQFRYLKEFCVSYRNHSVLLSLDDKHSISVGEPNAAVASLDRGRRVLTSSGTAVVALDHDFTKSKLTPSVALAIDIPDSITESFYRGKVFVGVKDAVFSPSSPLLHSHEVIDIIDQLHSVQPILAVYTDGGPDHRPTFLSVQLSWIALFRKLKLDMLIAVRTAPGQSFINPVERVMSLLNVALYGVSLERTRMDDQYETILGRCSSVSEIREKAKKYHKGLEEAFQESVATPAHFVSERSSRLYLKDQQFVSKHETANSEELTDLFESVKIIDPNVEMTDTTQKALSKCERLKKFLETHTIRHHYIFQVKKCGKQDCEFGCNPPVLPADTFSKLSWLPDPVFCPSSNKYLPYKDVYGLQPSEKDRPSKQQPAGVDSEHKELLVSTKARCTIVCCVCDKPRVVYSQSQLPHSVIQLVKGISSDYLYSCGSKLPIACESEQSQDSPVVREGINCDSPIEFAYYSSKKFKIVCSLCGGDDDCTVDETFKQEFQTVLPLCGECVSSGKQPITRGKF